MIKECEKNICPLAYTTFLFWIFFLAMGEAAGADHRKCALTHTVASHYVP